MCEKNNYIYSCGCSVPIIKYCSSYRCYNECNNIRYGNVYVDARCDAFIRFKPSGRFAVVNGESKTAEEVEQEKDEATVQK